MDNFFSVRQDDVAQRRIQLVIRDDTCPGLLDFLSRIPHGHESALLRGIVYQWLQDHLAADDLQEAVMAALNGPGSYTENVLAPAAASLAVKKQRRGKAAAAGRVARRATAPSSFAPLEAASQPLQSSPVFTPQHPARTSTPVQEPVPQPVEPIRAQPVVQPTAPVEQPAPAPVVLTSAPVTVNTSPVSSGEIDQADLDALADLENMI